MTKRYQRGNQNPCIEEEQTTQWSKDTKAPLVSFGHCVVCSSSIYRFWLPLWYLLVIVLSVLLQYTDSAVYWRRTDKTMTKRYQRGNQNLYIEEEQTKQWPKDTKGVIRICILKNSSSIYRFWLPLWYLLTIALSVLLQYTDSNYPFGIFWSLCCLFFFNIQNTMTKRYQRCNQNLYIEEEQTTQWPKDT
jgi:hypothetical protein